MNRASNATPARTAEKPAPTPVVASDLPAGHPVEENPGIPTPRLTSHRSRRTIEHGPWLPRTYVPRPRLWEQLDQAADSSITLLVAPAGAGKTLGVAGWLRQRSDAVPGQKAIWIQADETWDPERVTALLSNPELELSPTAGTPKQPGARPEPDADHVARIVIDDAHLLPAATHRLLDQRLNDEPDSMRLVLLSRWDLSITRLVPELLGDLAVIRGDALKLTDAEAATLIAEHGRTSAPEVIEAISQHAQGWCAVVVLDARAVAASVDPLQTARACADGQGHFGGRIANEVFAALSPRVRHLLLCLAAESIVTPRSAVHLTHDPEAGELLAELEATGLLVTRLTGQLLATDQHGELGDDEIDDGEPQYRIHPLLAEVVRRRLVAGGVDVARARATIVRAVGIDRGIGRTPHAIKRLHAVGAIKEMGSLVASDGLQMIMRGESDGLHAFARDHADQALKVPRAWFPLGVERWIAGDTTEAIRWFDRCLGRRALLSDDQDACIRLMRARVGLEDARDAIEFARVAAAHSKEHDVRDPVLPFLLAELGITEAWVGDLEDAEASLVTAAGIARTEGYLATAASAESHLALTEYMLGRERQCAETAEQVLAELADANINVGFVRGRLELAVSLARTVDVPWKEDITALDVPLHPADASGRFWLRVLQARAKVAERAIVEARRLLEGPLDLPEGFGLPGHVRANLLAERAEYAAVSSDRMALKEIGAELADAGMTAEAAFVDGLRADLDGDRRLAAQQFETAAEHAAPVLSITRPMALVARAQLLDESGEFVAAQRCLQAAAIETAVRRNAVPFLGWLRQGTPVAGLLQNLATHSAEPWICGLFAAMADSSGISTTFAPVTPTPIERDEAEMPANRPALSARERDVLHELARGSTYADIGAKLFVSENTVKTHVSNLYAKLGVSRRSEALAVARAMHLV